MTEDVFAAATDDLFASAIAQDAIYTPEGGEAQAIRVVHQRPDQINVLFGQPTAGPTSIFKVRVADVASPNEGDTIEVAGLSYVVLGQPRRDSRNLVWTIEAPPA